MPPHTESCNESFYRIALHCVIIDIALILYMYRSGSMSVVHANPQGRESQDSDRQQSSYDLLQQC